MTQAVVLNNLAKYLEALPVESNTTEREKLLSIIRQFANEGHCFALSALHAAMDRAGKLDWWENVLKNIANWDGNSESLQININELGIPDIQDSTQNLSPEKQQELQDQLLKQQQLEYLFVRVINYIASTFPGGKAYSDFHPKDFSEINMFDPDKGFFELLDDNGNIMTIQNRRIIGGHFDNSQIANIFLNENNIENTISSVYGFIDTVQGLHAIRIGYHNGKWIIYDPNYDHTSTSTIHKTFDNKEDAAAEIRSILGSNLYLEVASFDKDKEFDFSEYDKLMTNPTNDFLKDGGLLFIAFKLPELFSSSLEKIIDIALQEDDEGKKIKEMLAKELNIVRKTAQGPDTLFWMILKKFPEKLFDLLHMIDPTKEGKQMRESLKEILGENFGFTVVQRFAPNSIPTLVRLFPSEYLNMLKSPVESEDEEIELKKEIYQTISDVLVEQDNDSRSGLQSILINDQNAIPKLLELIDSSEEGMLIKKQIIDALSIQDVNGYTAIHTLVSYAPYKLIPLIETVLNDPTEYSLNQVLLALAKEDNLGETGWQKITNKFDEGRKPLLDLISKALIELSVKDYGSFEAIKQKMESSASYQGLRKHRHGYHSWPLPFIGGNPYGDTHIWKTITSAMNKISKEHDEQPKFQKQK